jgi:2'-hydroxyisoflavone reductase
MNLLILGGTVFVGRHLVEQALERGHDVTLFNRGRTNPELYPEVEHLHGDRDGGLAVLAGRKWDAVIDTCGYVPRVVRASAEALKDAVDHYTFVSSVSVYVEEGGQGPDEDSPVGRLEDETVEVVDGRTYGPLKALCEEAVSAVFGDRALNVRPGLIVGPNDPTGRFTWWPARADRGGPFVAPDTPDAPTQFIDVRDLASWMLDMVERGEAGAYNATGPVPPVTVGDVIAASLAAVGEGASNVAGDPRPAPEPVWVPEATLLELEVAPFMEQPLWVPREGWAFMEADVSRAVAQGLSFRPLAETVIDTLAWHRSLPEADRPTRAGLSPEKEAAVLATVGAC